jgi:hypothetical protein
MPIPAASMDPRRLAQALERVAGGLVPTQSPDEYEARMRKIRGRRQVLEGLAAAPAPQGQMVGRFYVAPSPLQNIAALGSQFLAGRASRRLDEEEQTAVADESRRLAEAYAASRRRNAGAASDRHASADLATFNSLPLGARQQLLAGQAAASLQPQAPEAFTLSPGQTRYQGDKVIAQAPQAAPTPTDDVSEYELAKQEGFRGNFTDWILEQRRAGATNVSVPVNTDKSFYGTLASERASSISELFNQAQKQPDRIARGQRVRELLDSGAITGAGAQFKLNVGRALKSIGFDYGQGDDIANTEVLVSQLAGATLDAIKTSGLGSGQGFTDKDRAFLENAVGGSIAIDAQSLRHLADLNERSALATMQLWNETAGRLDAGNLQRLGMSRIDLPSGPSMPRELQSMSDDELLRQLRGQ